MSARPDPVPDTAASVACALSGSAVATVRLGTRESASATSMRTESRVDRRIVSSLSLHRDDQAVAFQYGSVATEQPQLDLESHPGRRVGVGPFELNRTGAT